MASRHLKRLQNTDIKLQVAESSSEEGEESPEPQAKANPFSFLGEVPYISISALLGLTAWV